MLSRNKMHPQYITDEQGLKTSIIIPISEYEELMDDIEDLAAVADRRKEPSIPHEAFMEELRNDGVVA